LAKLPKAEQDRVRFKYWSALTDATAVKDGKLRVKVLISELEHGGYESAARCLSDDLDALVVHLRCPLRHRERWRSTNLLERSLREVRHRTEVMGRSPGETSCLSFRLGRARPVLQPGQQRRHPHRRRPPTPLPESSTNKPIQPPSTRRSQPHRLNRGNLIAREFTAANGRGPYWRELSWPPANQSYVCGAARSQLMK
jgi:hypothetical protein